MKHFLFWFFALLFCVHPAGADPLFEVKHIVVRSGGTSAVAARERGIELGQQAALKTIVERLTIPGRRSELPMPSLETLGAMVDALTLHDQHTSDQAYLGLMSIRFKPEAIERFLSNHAIPFSDSQARPLLVLPIIKVRSTKLLWEDNNPFTKAWQDLDQSGSLQTVLVPEGTDLDRRLGALELMEQGRLDGVQALAQAHEAEGVLITIAQSQFDQNQQLDGLIVSVERVGGRYGPEWQTFNYQLGQNEGLADLLAKATYEIASLYNAAWKSQSQVIGNRLTTVTFEVLFDDIAQWWGLENQLNQINLVQTVTLKQTTLNSVVADLTFRGRLEQLITVLAQNNLELIPGPQRYFMQRIR